MSISRNEVMHRLRERGATSAMVEFSGGNDQGGADRIVLYRGEEEIGELQEYYPEHAFDQEEKRWIRTPLPEVERRESELAEALSEPVYETYGGFSGDFDVSGVVVWDVSADEVRMDGEESVYRPFDTEYF